MFFVGRTPKVFCSSFTISAWSVAASFIATSLPFTLRVSASFLYAGCSIRRSIARSIISWSESFAFFVALDFSSFVSKAPTALSTSTFADIFSSLFISYSSLTFASTSLFERGFTLILFVFSTRSRILRFISRISSPVLTLAFVSSFLFSLTLVFS